MLGVSLPLLLFSFIMVAEDVKTKTKKKEVGRRRGSKTAWLAHFCEWRVCYMATSARSDKRKGGGATTLPSLDYPSASLCSKHALGPMAKFGTSKTAYRTRIAAILIFIECLAC